MATMTALQTQLTTASTFIQSQQGTLAEADLQSHMAAIARSVIAQINYAVIDFDSASTLTQIVRASAFTNAYKGSFTAAIAERAVHYTAQFSRAMRGTQSFLNLLNYFTRGDWARSSGRSYFGG